MVINKLLQRLTGRHQAQIYQGYIDERSTHHIAGWLRNLQSPAQRVSYEVVLEENGRTSILHSGVADGFSAILIQVGVGDGAYAFRHEFSSPLTPAQRDKLSVRPAGTAIKLELAPALITAPPGQLPPHFQGYLDERSTEHVAGWVRDLNAPERRIEIEILRPGPPETVLYRGMADQINPLLAQVGVGDGSYAFFHRFSAPLTEAERDTLFVRPFGTTQPLEHAPLLRTAPVNTQTPPRYQGYLDARSIFHVSGWVRDLTDPLIKLDIEVVLPDESGETILAALPATQDNTILRAQNIGDGAYGFYTHYSRAVTEAERDRIFVRPKNSSFQLDLSPALDTEFQPIHHVAMDIVNNCNLRCPFCVYDYENTHRTEFMTDETFASVLRLIPYVTEGNFWLSCLHEATLHPKLLDFIERVPVQYRKKLFFTTNLAKRMPPIYFEKLAKSGMHNINISLESLDPVIYERLRKGAKFKFFMEGWVSLLDAFARAGGHMEVPKIRYNLMAYRSNLHEIPALTKFLLAEKSAYQVEIRNTFDGPQISAEFRDAEFLTTAEWAWLEREMRQFTPQEVVLLVPPGGVGHDRYAKPVAPAAPAAETLPAPIGSPARPYNIRVAWDGTLNVYAEKIRQPGAPPTHVDYLVTNIHALEDPLATLFAL
jgi:molybdenum cofactor biosynthesis enzyme MoaA